MIGQGRGLVVQIAERLEVALEAIDRRGGVTVDEQTQLDGGFLAIVETQTRGQAQGYFGAFDDRDQSQWT